MMSKTLRSRVTTAIEQEMSPDERVQYLQQRVREMESQQKTDDKSVGELMLLLEDVKEIVDAGALSPLPVAYQTPKRKIKITQECAAMMHCTDWHIGRVTRSHEIEEWGEFNYQVATDRINQLVQAKMEVTEMERSNIVINDLVIASTGDMILGKLRESDIATAEFDPCVQVAKAANLWAHMLRALAPHFRNVRVEWTVPDNHSRLSKKFNSQEPWNSFNYLVAELLRAHMSAHDNVELNIHPGNIGNFEVLGRRYLSRHGHDMGAGGGGFGGIPYYEKDRSAGKEARRRMRRGREHQFARMLLGHLHAPVRTKDWWIGGCLSGTDNFDHTQGRESEPIQTGWLVHPFRGELNYNEYVLTNT